MSGVGQEGEAGGPSGTPVPTTPQRTVGDVAALTRNDTQKG